MAQEYLPLDAGETTDSGPDSDDSALEGILAELGNSGAEIKVNCYQVDPATKAKAYVGSFLPQQFSVEALQQSYGPGDYEIHVRRAGKIATRRVIKIAAPKINPFLPQVHNAPSPQNADMAKILETMNNGFQAMGAAMANAFQQMAQNQPRQKSTMEMLEEMRLMREVFGPAQPATPAINPLDVLNIAVGLSEKIHPREGEPGAGEIILEALKTFAPALQQFIPGTAQEAPQETTTPVLPQQNPASRQNVPVQNPEGNDNMNTVMKVYINTLLSAAKAQKDPETYANNIIDFVGEAKAREFVMDPRCKEKILQAVPAAAETWDWFADMIGIIVELTDPGMDDTKGEIDPGSAHNAPSSNPPTA